MPAAWLTTANGRSVSIGCLAAQLLLSSGYRLVQAADTQRMSQSARHYFED